jgi:hypothetical protein
MKPITDEQAAEILNNFAGMVDNTNDDAAKAICGLSAILINILMTFQQTNTTLKDIETQLITMQTK